MPEGGHVPTAGSSTIQPRQGATVSTWKIAATAKIVCRHGNLPHFVLLRSSESAMESYPHLSPGLQVSTVYSIIVGYCVIGFV